MQYDYCINKLGLNHVLDYLNISYEDDQISLFDKII